MIAYRLKHKESGLYYMPSRTITIKVDGRHWHIKSNLSKKGKLYLGIPSFKWYQSICNHLKPVFIGSGFCLKCRPIMEHTSPSDWELEEVA